MTTRRLSAITTLAAGALLLPALLAGCSAGQSGSDATDGATTATASKVGACMRDEGYDFDDADAPDAANQKDLHLQPPQGVDAQQWAQDLIECSGGSSTESTGGAAKVADPVPGASKRIAECVRDAGFDDYPDAEDERPQYHPADQDTFDRTLHDCQDEVLGSGHGTVPR